MKSTLYVALSGVSVNFIAALIMMRMRGAVKHPFFRASIILMLTSIVLAGCAGTSSERGTSVVKSSAAEKISDKEKGRVALVIGNNKYSRISKLENPANDAEDMADALKGFGFDVDIALDVDHQQMEKAIDRFIGKLGPEIVGLFYYAGHGFQIEGENFLLPVDYALNKATVKSDSCMASRLCERMEKAQAKVSIIILDACRNNPFLKDRSSDVRPSDERQIERGLAIMNPEKGTFIAFATGPNRTADENPTERNGLFTKHVLESLQEDPSCLNEVFDRAREDVYVASRSRQIPWTATNVIGRFCFKESPEPPDPKSIKNPVSPDCEGKRVADATSFLVDQKYAPSGILGDIDDVRIMPTPDSCIFEYEPTGKGPHEWDYKYINGERNPNPAGFGGVFYLDPPNNFGTSCGGFDLRKFRRVIRWEARSLDRDVNVEFIIGGIDWIWDERNKKKIKPLYPDSMPRVSLGVKKLTPVWQTFDSDLSDRPESEFARVINGFTWVISWGMNGVRFNEDRTGPDRPKTFRLEIRNIRYER